MTFVAHWTPQKTERMHQKVKRKRKNRPYQQNQLQISFIVAQIGTCDTQMERGGREREREEKKRKGEKEGEREGEGERKRERERGQRRKGAGGGKKEK